MVRRVKRILSMGLSMALLLGMSIQPVSAKADENDCVKKTNFQVVDENDLFGLLELASNRSRAKSQDAGLLVKNSGDQIVVEQVKQERAYEDGTVEKDIVASLITIIDEETKKVVTMNDLQNGYTATLSGNFSASQTLYATARFEGNLIQKVRCDKSTMVVYSAPNGVKRATQRLRVQGIVPVAEGESIDISQQKTSPGYGTTYTLYSTNTKWYNLGAMEIEGNLDVLLNDGHGGRSDYKILSDWDNPPYITYY